MVAQIRERDSAMATIPSPDRTRLADLEGLADRVVADSEDPAGRVVGAGEGVGRSVERKESAHCGARNAWRASGSIASITASPMCLEVPLSTPDRIPFIKLTRRRFPAGPKWPI